MADHAPPIPIARPWMGQPEGQAAARPVRSAWVAQGPEVAAFEQEFAALVGAPHACAVANGTAALHLALLAAGVGPGDEVITVSHSHIATASAVRYCGALPVFVDIDPATFNLEPTQLPRACTEQTRAVLCVHQMGMPCDLAAIVAFAGERGLAVVEDAACAVGSEVLWHGSWEPVGCPHGDIACFSFHPRKVITTGEGGMVTTRRAEWDRRVRRWRQHGMAPPRGGREVAAPTYPSVGYNYRLTDIQAAIGREQLKRLPEILRRYRRLAARYAELLGGVPGLQLPREPPWARTNWQSYCVRLPDGCDQRAVMEHLLARGVSSRTGIMCAHREAAYADLPLRLPLPESERAQDRCITLPMFAQMTDAEHDRVAAALREACQKA